MKNAADTAAATAVERAFQIKIVMVPVTNNGGDGAGFGFFGFLFRLEILQYTASLSALRWW